MKEKNAALLLLFTSLIWGMTFVFQSAAADLIGPFMFNGIRMLLGFLVLFPFAERSSKKRRQTEPGYIKKVALNGLLCGVFLSSACYFQQAGLIYTTAGKGAFITALYILFVPLFGLVTGNKPSRSAWLYAIMGLLGAYLISVNHEGGINKGDLLIFICAFLFTFQIMAVDYGAKSTGGAELAASQMFSAGLICLICGLLFEPFHISMVKDALISILYAGIFSCAVAYTLQVVSQKYLRPEKASLVMCLESAWAAIGSAVFLKERMTIREITGCAVLFAAVILSNLPSRKEGNV